MRVILHFGLHKTGTKFYQHKVFPLLGGTFSYNPPKLTQYVTDLCRINPDDKQLEGVVIGGIRTEIASIEDQTTVLISREIMAGNLFDFYTTQTQDNIERLSAAFPDAEIIVATRNPADWMLSCYREFVHEHNFVTLDDFLDEKIGPECLPRWQCLDVGGIVRQLSAKFKVVHCLRFEELIQQREVQLERMANILNVSHLDAVADSDKIPNRGYSAFAIALSIKRAKFLSALGLNTLMHRPIKFFGRDGIPAGSESSSLLPKETYWGKQFYRDNEEVRSANYPNLTIYEKIKQKCSWRFLMKEVVDKIYYLDWDLLKKRRDEIDRFYT